MTTTNAPSKYTREEYVLPPHTACPGCAMATAMRQVLKALGEKIVLVVPPGCGSVFATHPRRAFKYRGESIPVLTTSLGAAAACASGFKTGRVLRGDTETEVVVFAGDGATYDIGLQTISAAAERNEDILYVCFDNEIYGNTGGQRSSATPRGARTTTSLPPASKAEPKKDMIAIMMAHAVPYIATATIAYPDDLMEKVIKAKGVTGFRFINILTPCVSGWLFRSELTVKVSRLAVETRLFPLLEIEDKRLVITRQPEGLPVRKFVELQGRYQHLTQEQIDQFQEYVDQKWRELVRLAGHSRTS